MEHGRQEECSEECLKLEEKKLEEQLATYKTQLTSVTHNITSKDDETRGTSEEIDELRTLKADLEELVSLTQESLLEVKKQVLLSTLNIPLENEEPLVVGGETADILLSHDDAGSRAPMEEGIKCRAPFAEEVSWRGVSYHNALVLCEEPNDKVRVLYTHPRFDSMKPCPFFLEGNCKYTEESCRYSHGHVVSVDTLYPFTDPQYSSLRCGSQCLVKRSDGLWYDAIVRNYGDIVTVQFTTSFGDVGEVEVTLEDILPLSGSDNDDDSDSSSTDNNNTDNDNKEEGVRVIDWQPSSSSALGEWEQYTTGIGSKLLSKMGYVFGKGLGKDNQGRVEPVPIEILPAGKSLDACAAIKEEKKLKGEKQKKKKRRKKKIGNTTSVKQTTGLPAVSSNMFDFINTQLSQDSGSTSAKGSEIPHHSGRSGSGGSGKTLNIELFQIQEKISSVEKMIKTLSSRIKEKKDKRVQEHIQKKLKSANNELTSLRKQERLLMNKVKRKTNETKLSVF